MKIAESLLDSGLEEIKTALDGGTLVLYSVARPASPDRPVQRSGVLATSSVITSKPAIHDHFKTGQRNGLRTRSSFTLSTVDLASFPAGRWLAGGSRKGDFSGAL